jgi:hypothetical protein
MHVSRAVYAKMVLLLPNAETVREHYKYTCSHCTSKPKLMATKVSTRQTDNMVVRTKFRLDAIVFCHFTGSISASCHVNVISKI